MGRKAVRKNSDKNALELFGMRCGRKSQRRGARLDGQQIERIVTDCTALVSGYQPNPYRPIGRNGYQGFHLWYPQAMDRLNAFHAWLVHEDSFRSSVQGDFADDLLVELSFLARQVDEFREWLTTNICRGLKRDDRRTAIATRTDRDYCESVDRADETD